jgi:hypothetical protein
VSTDSLHHSSHRHHRQRCTSYRNVNYEELNVGNRREAEEQNPYAEHFRAIEEEHRSLFKKIALLNLSLLVAVIICLWLASRWVLLTYPPPD